MLQYATIPRSTFQRFRQLPPHEIIRALNFVYELHYQLAQLGWIAVDFYDGCMIYDFDHQDLHIVDLDNYCDAPFINEMGRMFGSSRFMAPEEFDRGAHIDERYQLYSLWGGPQLCCCRMERWSDVRFVEATHCMRWFAVPAARIRESDTTRWQPFLPRGWTHALLSHRGLNNLTDGLPDC